MSPKKWHLKIESPTPLYISLALICDLSYRVSGKKRYSPFWLVFHSACADFFETCDIYRLKHGKKDECKIKVFVILPDVDRAFCVETYISSRSFSETRGLLDRKPGWDHRKTRLAPNNATINKWANSKEPGCFAGNRTGQRQTSLGPLRGAPPAGRAAVRPGQPSPERSVSHRAREARTETDLAEHDSARRPANPYRIRARQKLTSEDRSRRVKMAQWFAEHSAVLGRLWFTDGAHFWLSGHVNSCNAFHWGYSVPVKVLTKSLYSDKVTAWIAMGREGVQIGMLFFFEHERGVAETVNAERYLKLKLPERTEMSSTNANVIHRSFCHSIWNTMISEFLTWYAYFRFHRRIPQYHFFPDTLYVIC